MDLQGYRFLLVLIAVIVGGIVAAKFIIPAFTDDAERIRLAGARGLIYAAGARKAVADYYKANHDWPQSNAQAGLPPPSQLYSNTIAALEIQAGGKIVLSFSDEIGELAGHRLYLQPAAEAGNITWTCRPLDQQSSSWPRDWLPLNCRPDR